METDAPHIPERVAGKFSSVEQDIVSTRANRSEPQRLNGVENDSETLAEIEFCAWEDDREIQISEIVVNGSAAGAASREESAFVLKQSRFALRPRVLIASDDDSVLILPQKENGAGRVLSSLCQIAFAESHEVLFKR